jgi:hypothetical protein
MTHGGPMVRGNPAAGRFEILVDDQVAGDYVDLVPADRRPEFGLDTVPGARPS